MNELFWSFVIDRIDVECDAIVKWCNKNALSIKINPISLDYLLILYKLFLSLWANWKSQFLDMLDIWQSQSTQVYYVLIICQHNW